MAPLSGNSGWIRKPSCPDSHSPDMCTAAGWQYYENGWVDDDKLNVTCFRK